MPERVRALEVVAVSPAVGEDRSRRAPTQLDALGLGGPVADLGEVHGEQRVGVRTSRRVLGDDDVVARLRGGGERIGIPFPAR